MRKHPQIVIGVLLIALFVCIAITAPLLAPNDPNATNLALKMPRHQPSILLDAIKWGGVNFRA